MSVYVESLIDGFERDLTQEWEARDNSEGRGSKFSPWFWKIDLNYKREENDKEKGEEDK